MERRAEVNNYFAIGENVRVRRRGIKKYLRWAVASGFLSVNERLLASYFLDHLLNRDPVFGVVSAYRAGGGYASVEIVLDGHTYLASFYEDDLREVE